MIPEDEEKHVGPGRRPPGNLRPLRSPPTALSLLPPGSPRLGVTAVRCLRE